MKENILASWNNRRRTFDYWLIAFAFAINPSSLGWWTDVETGFFAVYRDILYRIFEVLFFQSRPFAPYVMIMLSPGLFCILFLWIFNGLIGRIPERCAAGRLFEVTAQPAFLADVVVGLVLAGIGWRNFRASCNYFWDAYTRDTIENLWGVRLMSVLLLLMFLSCIAIYWKGLLPFRTYRQTFRSLKQKDFEDTAWFCVSNSPRRFSSFSRFMNKGQLGTSVFDHQDLRLLRKQTGIHLDAHDFRYFVIIVDRSQRINDAFLAQIEQILRIPHAHILVCYTKTNPSARNFETLDALLHSNKTAVFRDCCDFEDRLHLKLQDLLAVEEPGLMDEKRLPLSYLHDERLKTTYLKLAQGPRICLDFLQIIFCKLDVLPGIYALFDYVDLQYRIQLAFEQPWLDVHAQSAVSLFERWAVKHGRKIGNIREMATLLEDGVLTASQSDPQTALSTADVFSKVFSEDDLTLIRKYLPNYTIDYDRPGYLTIIYLTTNLRNVLRGHGYFDPSDANRLFEVIVKLSMMNTYILSGNSVSLQISEEPHQGLPDLRNVDGQIGSEAFKRLSPFLIASDHGSILCFNNCHKRKHPSKPAAIEYINYLDGTIILPNFRSVSHTGHNDQTKDG